MDQELEPYERGDLVPYYRPPMEYRQSDIPLWMDPVPEFDDGEGWWAALTRGWSYLIRWPRYVAIAFLMATFKLEVFLLIASVVGVMVWLLTGK